MSIIVVSGKSTVVFLQATAPTGKIAPCSSGKPGKVTSRMLVVVFKYARVSTTILLFTSIGRLAMDWTDVPLLKRRRV